ncbi:peroxiredoxin [Vagococcus penaei]|uniref:Peroxiredoxin n=1 Tax=Vagococcus penaei TaxID=633807 RepID=A0A1Q2D744_9ENTE|nr:OsmC family protein [Vagococcus penaei]AQP54095.1 peroxiredoxin [Vagococcus penaei]RSU02092.1 peroxiredoxin [Vagococcus penaei]
MAIEVYKAETYSTEGLQVVCRARQFEMVLDEPKNIGGTDAGMTPVEALLCSLGACKVIVARAFSKSHKIHLKDIRVELEGELDTDGFMGKNSEAKIGFSKITSHFFIDADNTEDEIIAFVEFINATCPVHDTMSISPKFDTKVNII